MREKLLFISLLFLAKIVASRFSSGLLRRRDVLSRMHGSHRSGSMHHVSKSGEFEFRAPFLQLFRGEKISHFDQVFNRLLLLFRFELDDFRVLGTERFDFDGRADEKLAELQTLCKNLRPEKLGLAEVRLLNQFKILPLLPGEVKLGSSPARILSSPLSHSHSGRLRKGGRRCEDRQKKEDQHEYS